MWGLFSRDPASSFPYEVGEELWREESRSIWRLHKGKKKQGGEEVSVFVCEGAAAGGAAAAAVEVAKAAVKKLKTLRHPCVLTFLDSLESERLVYLVTEPVTPLSPWLRQSHPTQALAWGLLQVTRALSFLNNEGGLAHHNVCAASVFVTPAGDWKLAGAEYSSADAPPPNPQARPLPALAVYSPPEAADPAKAAGATKWASDMWGLGCLVWETFSGRLDQSTSLRDTSKIPPSLVGTYTRLVGAAPGSRPNPREVVETLARPGGFFHNDLILTLSFLEELHIKEAEDKTRFLSKLTGKLDGFPEYVSKHKVLPALLAAHHFSGVGAVILGPLFKIGKLLGDVEYQQQILPCVVQLFSSHDRATRLKLLQGIEALSAHMSPATLNGQVFPQLATGFLDTNPTIREHTVKAILHLAPNLNYNNLNVEVLKHFARLQARDDQGGIRTNTTVCLGKVAGSLHPDVRQKCLVSAFTRATRDPFPPARVAGVMALAATQQYYPLQHTAHRILPTLCQLTVDPEVSVREAAFRVLKGFITKLEKVSEDPSLRDEMEREVKSQSGVAGGPQSSWAGWAVGALTSKFYKSSITVMPSTQSKTSPSPSPSPSTPSTKSSSLAPPSPPSLTSGAGGSKWEDSAWGSLDSFPEAARRDGPASPPSSLSSPSTTLGLGGEGEGEEEGAGWEDEEWGSLEDGIDSGGGDINRPPPPLPASSVSAPAGSCGLAPDNADDFFSCLISWQGPSTTTTRLSNSTSLQFTAPPSTTSATRLSNSTSLQFNAPPPPAAASAWDEWDNSSSHEVAGGVGAPSGLGRGSESCRREREERRAKRQKEIEAKRAAKAGPMKLAARRL